MLRTALGVWILVALAYGNAAAQTTTLIPAAAPTPPASGYIGRLTIPKIGTDPPIDGTLTDPAWKTAAVAHLTYDLRNHQRATEATTVYLMQDDRYIYVGIDAKQSIPVRTTEHTDMVGLDTDDEFQVDLWPNGTSGFRYKFTSTANGTHYEYSTENNSFEPSWQSAGRVVPGGYVITMRIPLNVMHGTGSANWKIQLIRYMPVTNDSFVWSYGPSQSGFNDVNYAGYADGLPQLTALKAKPRVGIYALGSIASPTAGGSTSRMGADFSVPLVPGLAFVGTLHPDYSDVEVDQQTIAPSAFQRIYNEVRPFFTQGANFYNYPNGICAGCPGILELYTPDIPTPRDGFAVEGQHSLFNYAAFDAIGDARIDTAQSVNYVSPNQQTSLNFQRSSANFGDVSDVAAGFTVTHDNLKNFMQFARYADDSGTQVLDAARAQRYEGGLGFYQPDGSSIYAVLREVGQYFDPVDGIVQHPDIAGYNVNFYKPFKYSPKDRFTELDISGNLDRYHDHTGVLDQTDNGLAATLNTRTLFQLQASIGSSYLLLQPGDFSPITQEGAQLSYNINSSLPTYLLFNTGRYGPGRLDSWTRSATFRAGQRGAITFDADDTKQFTDAGTTYTQWLERFSYAYQTGPNQSLALGVRRIIGFAPQLTQVQPFQDGWNLSAAYHRKVPGGELYVVYGDAAAFSTVPQFIVKYIKYVGADKGT